MILRKKTLESRLVYVLAEIILEDSLPIHIDIGLAKGGMIQVLFSFEPENEPIFQNLINNILDTIYP